MVSTTTGNGQGQRKQLAHQLDRFDEILDGLAAALNESVADAVRGAVGQAVREAVETSVREVLSSPELLRAALAKHEPPAPPAPPPEARGVTAGQALAAALAGLWPRAREAASAARQVPR